MRRSALLLLCGVSVVACSAEPPAPTPTGSNALAMAVAWKETSAEYEALYLQGFNIAKMRVEQALSRRRSAPSAAPQRPLAVISDLDDTVLDTRDYWREALASNEEFFSDVRWDAWVAKNNVKASPGALDFLTFCHEGGVEVFYITSRDQGTRTMELALGNIRAAGLPFADAEHLSVLTASSDKGPRQREIAQTHDIVVYLGDNLNDFSRSYYLTDIAARRNQLAVDRDAFGSRFILFPNPTDGHWVRAIFGDSEPPPTPENLERLHQVIGRRPGR
jgi:5'-nucleotidase (lipoprotein e(P4) family)